MKNLKKFWGILCIFALSVCFTVSCEDTGVKALVEVADAKCPMDLGNGMSAVSFNYSDNTVECVVELDEKMYDLNQFGMNIDMAKEGVLNSLKSGTANEDPLMEAIKKDKKDLRYTYVGKQSGKQFSFVIHANEY